MLSKCALHHAHDRTMYLIYWGQLSQSWS